GVRRPGGLSPVRPLFLRDWLGRQPRRRKQPRPLARCAVACWFKQPAVGAVAFSLQIVSWDEAEGGGVDAVPQASGFRGPVVEQVTQVTAAVGGADLSPGYQHF